MRDPPSIRFRGANAPTPPSAFFNALRLFQGKHSLKIPRRVLAKLNRMRKWKNADYDGYVLYPAIADPRSRRHDEWQGNRKAGWLSESVGDIGKTKKSPTRW
jgi:hypothetical protein